MVQGRRFTRKPNASETWYPSAAHVEAGEWDEGLRPGTGIYSEDYSERAERVKRMAYGHHLREAVRADRRVGDILWARLQGHKTAQDIAAALNTSPNEVVEIIEAYNLPLTPVKGSSRPAPHSELHWWTAFGGTEQLAAEAVDNPRGRGLLSGLTSVALAVVGIGAMVQGHRILKGNKPQ